MGAAQTEEEHYFIYDAALRVKKRYEKSKPTPHQGHTFTAEQVKFCCFLFLEKFIVDYHCTRVRSKENVQDFFCKVASSFLILFIVSYQFPEGKDRLKLFYMEPLLQHYLCTQSLYQCRISEIRLTLRCHIDSM